MYNIKFSMIIRNIIFSLIIIENYSHLQKILFLSVIQLFYIKGNFHEVSYINLYL